MHTRKTTALALGSATVATLLVAFASGQQVDAPTSVLENQPNDSLTKLRVDQDAMRARILRLEKKVASLEERIQPVTAQVRPPRTPTSVPKGKLEVIGDEVYRIRSVPGRYTGGMTGHWINRNIADGKFITLEDDSLWEIDSIDTITTSLWMTTSEIIVLPHEYSGIVLYELVNTDDDEKVDATFRGYGHQEH